MIGDGIYDKLENEDIIKEVWNLLYTREASDIHELNKLAVEAILRESLLKKSLDNVTSVMITFAGLADRYSSELATSKQPRLHTGSLHIPYTEKPHESDNANLNPERANFLNGNRNSNSTDNNKKFATLDEKKYRSITGKDTKEFNLVVRPESSRSLSQANIQKQPYSRNTPRS